jgi:hypothetical protein
MSTEKQKKNDQGHSHNTGDRQGTDKMPEQEKDKKEKVTSDDLKGKKVDADPEKESDKPLESK